MEELGYDKDDNTNNNNESNVNEKDGGTASS